MSADNGIYILQTDGPEFRVQHCQAIENINWDHVNKCYTEKQDVWIRNAREMFETAPVFTDKGKALLFAMECSEKYSILEYGIQPIEIARKF